MKEIMNIIGYEIDKFNKRSKKIYINILDNDVLKEKCSNLECDYRINDTRYTIEPLNIGFFSDEYKEALAISTLIIFSKEDFPKIKFWHYNDNQKLLKKTSLRELYIGTSAYAMTIGYTQTSNRFKNKYRSTKFFVDLTRNITLNTNTCFFIECTGKEWLQSFSKKEEIYLQDQLFELRNLGVTNEKSKPVEKFVRLLNFKKADNIYNIWTLGQVYFNKKIE